MKTHIEVTARREGELLRAGLDDPQVRAFVKVCAILKALPTDRARSRVLRFMSELMSDPDFVRAPATAAETGALDETETEESRLRID